jgi:3',5'-cyclic-AMP phosphodiesterase
MTGQPIIPFDDAPLLPRVLLPLLPKTETGMKLIHMSDLHLTRPGTTIGGRDPNINFARALDHAFADHADADLLAITGDLSDWGDRDDYLRLRDLLARAPVPVRLCIGNHDNRAAFLSVFPEHADEEGFAQGMADIAGFRCLFLDTKAENTHAGHLCPARRRWLEARLSEHSGPFVIFLHHNPMPTHLAPLDEIGLKDDAVFRGIIARHAGTIRHVFFGHCHLPFSGSIAGVACASLRGTNHAGFIRFAEREKLIGADLPEAYGIARLEPDYTSVLMIEFGYSGTVRIEGSPDYAAWNRRTMVR